MNNKALIPALGLAVLSGCSDKLPEKPNIIYLMFDDLGYGDLGCYGQELIETPNIDALASRGVFTDMYTNCPLSAPSRCSIVTGLHTGHSQIRHNDERVARDFEGMPDWYFDRMRADSTYEGQYALLAGTETVGTMMQKAGYSGSAAVPVVIIFYSPGKSKRYHEKTKIIINFY